VDRTNTEERECTLAEERLDEVVPVLAETKVFSHLALAVQQTHQSAVSHVQQLFIAHALTEMEVQMVELTRVCGRQAD
jgi:hypothetical protein